MSVNTYEDLIPSTEKPKRIRTRVRNIQLNKFLDNAIDQWNQNLNQHLCASPEAHLDPN